MHIAWWSSCNKRPCRVVRTITERASAGDVCNRQITVQCRQLTCSLILCSFVPDNSIYEGLHRPVHSLVSGFYCDFFAIPAQNYDNYPTTGSQSHSRRLVHCCSALVWLVTTASFTSRHSGQLSLLPLAGRKWAPTKEQCHCQYRRALQPGR